MGKLQPERVAHLTLGVLGLAVMLGSVEYGLGSLRKPGPGLFPFCAGFLLASAALALFARRQTKTNQTPFFGSGRVRPFAGMIVALAFWVVAMPVLGYPIVTGITTFAVSKLMKLEGWLRPFALALGTALFIYLLFDYRLYIDLPRGLLG